MAFYAGVPVRASWKFANAGLYQIFLIKKPERIATKWRIFQPMCAKQFAFALASSKKT
jgi:hypothetical protein